MIYYKFDINENAIVVYESNIISYSNIVDNYVPFLLDDIYVLAFSNSSYINVLKAYNVFIKFYIDLYTVKCRRARIALRREKQTLAKYELLINK